MLFDTFAWIEYFTKTQNTDKVKKILFESPQCFTSAISLAELSQWIEKENLNRSEILSNVKKLSLIIDLNNDLLEFAGIINFNKRKSIKDFGLIDSIILATAKAHNLQLVTGDKHFANEPNVLLL